MLKMYPAKRYEAGSGHRVAYMYVRQFKFPEYYDNYDLLWSRDSESIGRRHLMHCFLKYQTGVTCETNRDFFKHWASKANADAIFAFLTELLNVQKKDWTGFRIMASKHEDDHLIWHFQLFYRSPKSEATTLYSYELAPNVITR